MGSTNNITWAALIKNKTLRVSGIVLAAILPILATDIGKNLIDRFKEWMQTTTLDEVDIRFDDSEAIHILILPPYRTNPDEGGATISSSLQTSLEERLDKLKRKELLLEIESPGVTPFKLTKDSAEVLGNRYNAHLVLWITYDLFPNEDTVPIKFYYKVSHEWDDIINEKYSFGDGSYFTKISKLDLGSIQQSGKSIIGLESAILYNVATVYRLNKEYKKSEELLDTVYNNENGIISDGNFNAFIARSYLKLKRNNLETSQYRTHINDNIKALSFERDSFKNKIYNNLCIIYRKINKYDSALIWIQKALDEDPMYAKGYSNQGNIYMDKKDTVEAIKSYIKAYDLDHNDVINIYNLASTLYDKGDYEQSLRYINLLIEKKYKRPESLYFSALNKYYLGDTATAKDEIYQAYKIRPEDEDILEAYAMIRGEISE